MPRSHLHPQAYDASFQRPKPKVPKHRTVGSEDGPHSPSPKSQSLSLSYGPNLPTSLTYILPKTRGFEPWRPAAVMGTSRGANKSAYSAFHGSAPAHRTSKNLDAFPVVDPYRRTNQFQGRTTVKKKRELFPGPVSNLPRALALPHTIHVLVPEF